MNCNGDCCEIPEALLNHSPDTDMLCCLFKDQASLESFMGYDFSTMDEKARGEYVRLHTLMIADELHEMLHEIPFFKPWKKYSMAEADNAIRWQKARMEMVDALHFFLSTCIALGFTAEELFMMYEAKLQENYTRQQNTAEYKKDTE